jgi:hypothetical protein
MALQILIVWAKGSPSTSDQGAVLAALQTAQAIFTTLTLNVWGQVNLEEQGPLPSSIGYTEDQDYVDADGVAAKALRKVRDLYLDANRRLAAPVYVLFIVPVGELKSANGFSLRGGYCSVMPVPTGAFGTADGHTYAHEVGHGLSLVHSDDTQNLMCPFRVLPTGLLSGDTLTVDQYKQIRAFLKAHQSLLEP